MANIKMLEEVMDYIKTHPEQLRQDVWATQKADCGTACCFAGWTAVLNGYQLDWLEDDDMTSIVRDKDGIHHVISDLAEELLDLTQFEGDVLFAGSNTIDELEQMVKNLANGAHIKACLAVTVPATVPVLPEAA